MELGLSFAAHHTFDRPTLFDYVEREVQPIKAKMQWQKCTFMANKLDHHTVGFKVKPKTCFPLQSATGIVASNRLNLKWISLSRTLLKVTKIFYKDFLFLFNFLISKKSIQNLQAKSQKALGKKHRLNLTTIEADFLLCCKLES